MRVFQAKKGELGREALDEIAGRIKKGEVFVYPTDTVYGLGCDAMNEEAVKRVFGIKKRALDKPVSVAFASIGQIKEFAQVKPSDEAVLEEKLPGPYTFIVGRGRIPKAVTGGSDTVGARIPDSDLVVGLAERAGPIITTSANMSGEPAPADISEVSKGLLEKVDFIIDAGRAGSGKPSRVIDLASGEVLR